MSTEFNQDDALDQELNASAFGSAAHEPGRQEKKKSSWLLYLALGIACAALVGGGLWNMFGKRLFAQSPQQQQSLQMEGDTFTAQPALVTQSGPGTPSAGNSYPIDQRQANVQHVQAQATSPVVPPAVANVQAVQHAPQTTPAQDLTFADPASSAPQSSVQLGAPSVGSRAADEVNTNAVDRLIKIESSIEKLQAQVDDLARQTLVQQGVLKGETEVRHQTVISALVGIEKALNVLAEAMPARPAPKANAPTSKAAPKPEAKVAPKERAEPTKPTQPVRPTVTLRGILEERATLQTRSGESISVVVGDKLPGSSATVTRVDPDRGEVSLSDGQVLR